MGLRRKKILIDTHFTQFFFSNVMLSLGNVSSINDLYLPIKSVTKHTHIEKMANDKIGFSFRHLILVLENLN